MSNVQNPKAPQQPQSDMVKSRPNSVRPTSTRADNAQQNAHAKRYAGDFEELMGNPNITPFDAFHPMQIVNKGGNQQNEEFMGGRSAQAQALLSARQENVNDSSNIQQSLMNKLSHISTLRDMSFSIENSKGCIQVDASLAGAVLRCSLKASNEALRRKLNNSKSSITNALSNGLRVRVDLNIADEE